MPDPVEEGQANYSRRYKPIDSAQYQNEQAQAYYERMRAKMRKQSRSIMRGGGFRSTGSESLYQTIGPIYDDPAKSTYRTRHRRDRAYADDVAERAFQTSTNAVQSFTGFAAEFGVGEVIESGVGKALYQGGARTGFASSYLGSTAVGVGAGLVGAGVAAAGIEGTMRYTGTYDAVSQNQEIQNLRSISRGFTSSTASGPRGRASQDMSQNIMTNMAEMGRSSMAINEGDDLSELKEQVGILSDFSLMEGVNDAEEFEKKFGELKEGVKKITEVLGTTFEEGARMLKDFRNMGVGPSQGVQMLNQGRLTSAEYGTNFRQGHAAGMQSSLAMRGTGFTAGAGYAMGQQAQGSANAIYDNQLLSDRMVYNMGGKTGIKQKIQRGNMNYLQSPQFTAAMMGSMTEQGKFDMGRLVQTAMGERTMEQNAAAANQNISSLGDMMSYRANQQKAVSKMIEANPQFLNAMKTRSIMNVAEQMGQNPSNMTERELAQYAPQVGLTSQQAMASFADVRSNAETLGREDAERERVAQGRASDMFQTSILGRASEGLREAPLFQGAVQLGSTLETATRNNVYSATKEISRRLSSTFNGTTQVTMRGEVADQFRKIDGPTDQPTGEEVFFQDPSINPLADPSQAEVMRELMSSGQREGMERVEGQMVSTGITGVTDKKIAQIPEKGMRELLKAEGMSDEEIEKQISDSNRYTMDELAELNIAGIKGTKSEARLDNIMESGRYEELFSYAVDNLGLSRAGQRDMSDNTMFVPRSTQKAHQQADKDLANAFKSAFEGNAPTRKSQMTEEARAEFRNLRKRFGDISEDEMQGYVDDYGDDGGTAPEFRERMYQMMKNEYDIKGEVGTAKFKSNLATFLDENEDASNAIQKVEEQMLTGSRQVLSKALTTFPEVDPRSSEGVRQQLEQARTSIEQTASEVFSEQDGDIFGLDLGIVADGEKLNKLQETGTKDLIAGLAAARRAGDQEAINAMKDKLSEVGGGMISEANKIIDSMSKKEMTNMIGNFSTAAQQFDLLAGEGQQTANSTGVGSKLAEGEEKKRLDKLANMAVDNTADALMKLGANNEKQTRIMNEMLSELRAM
jgi:hypothetical protein